MSILDLTALELGKKIKAGEITSPQATEAVIKQIKAVEELGPKFLFPYQASAIDFEAARAVHASARALFDQLNADGLGLDTLSMGMSDDLEAAIAAGSTMVRVGSGIFGARS